MGRSNGGKRVFERLGVQPPSQSNIIPSKKQKVCRHEERGSPVHEFVLENPNQELHSKSPQRTHTPKAHNTVCRFWEKGNCSYGDGCRYLHQWFSGDGFNMLTQLPGHDKDISGMAFPSGSDKLYSGSKDSSLKVWDCKSGECVDVINMGGEVGCVMSEGPWVFVGTPNSVKAWNIKTNADFSFGGAVGQVHAFAEGNEMLFAGTEDGTILAWRFSATTICFEQTAVLRGHSAAVVSLIDGTNRLYSGSMDNTIRVWNIESETFQCVHILKEHKSVVTSLICWNEFLLSCSLDRTIKVWGLTEKGSIEVMYTHKEEHGVMALSGIKDAQAKPILMCSCKDKTVHLYDLPSFVERGKIFSKEEITSVQIGPGGLFFTGDKIGEMKVWKLSETTTAS